MKSEPQRDLGRIVATMTQSLFHRGPDDGGVVTFGPVNSTQAIALGSRDDAPQTPDSPVFAAIGARRLAILDLSPRGHMPMPSSDRLAWIVYNGEVYNHAELRDTLAADGWLFSTGTDTEVVLAAWQAWGPRCFDRFDGMWAIAIYEPDARRLILSRDPFGIKPLYYSITSRTFAFGSEIKALLAIPGAEDRANLGNVAAFIESGLIDHNDQTLFDGIHSVYGGTMMTVSLAPDGRMRHAVERVCAMPVAGGGTSPDAAQLRAIIDHSVRMQLRSDVPVGSCLSGGIDSSTIVASIEAQHMSAYAPSVFTAVLPGDALDESRHVDTLVASVAGLQSHRVAPTAAGLVDLIDDLLRHQEVPFGSPSIYMQWEVMRLARQSGITVMLDGQGADELFRGYAGYLPPLVAQLALEGRPLRALALLRAPHARDHYSTVSLTSRALAHLLPSEWRVAWGAAWRSVTGRVGISGSLLTRELRTAADRQRHLSNMPVAGRACDREWLRVLLHTSLPSLLHFEDRNSMAHSIEARVPFLGCAVAAAAAAIPAEQALAGGQTKAALRASQRGRVPDAILDRRDKIGFAAPTAAWMRGALRPWWTMLLNSATCRGRGWLSARTIASLSRRFEQGDDRCALALWRCAITEAWARKWKV